ncbi:Guanine nucleotide-binding protein subunit beta-like protein [Coccomyxa sp. Obi]|nr:Guanine nucleotide-binding protein subunit beta-like protein [Coccomyxa sp. Obi]
MMGKRRQSKAQKDQIAKEIREIKRQHSRRGPSMDLVRQTSLTRQASLSKQLSQRTPMALQKQPRPSPDPEFILRGHRTDVQALLFHPQLDLLYSGDAEGGLLIWDLQQRRPVSSRRLHPPSAGVLSLAWLDNMLLSQGRDGAIKGWAIADDGSCSRDPILVVQTYSYNFCRCSVIPSAPGTLEERLSSGDAAQPKQDTTPRTEGVRKAWLLGLAGSDPATVELWKVVGSEAARWKELKQREEAKMGMCMALQLFKISDSEAVYAAAGYEDGTVAVWDADEADSPIMSSRLHSEPIMALTIDPSGKGGVSSSAEDRLAVFSIEWDKLELHKQADIPLKKPGVAALAQRHDGKVLASAGWDGRVRLFHRKTQRPLAVLQYHRSGVQDVCFDQKSKLLASASKDGSIALWSVFTDT